MQHSVQCIVSCELPQAIKPLRLPLRPSQLPTRPPDPCGQDKFFATMSPLVSSALATGTSSIVSTQSIGVTGTASFPQSTSNSTSAFARGIQTYNLGAIIGGVASGSAILLSIGILIIYMKRKRTLRCTEQDVDSGSSQSDRTVSENVAVDAMPAFSSGYTGSLPYFAKEFHMEAEVSVLPSHRDSFVGLSVTPHTSASMSTPRRDPMSPSHSFPYLLPHLHSNAATVRSNLSPQDLPPAYVEGSYFWHPPTGPGSPAILSRHPTLTQAAALAKAQASRRSSAQTPS